MNVKHGHDRRHRDLRQYFHAVDSAGRPSHVVVQPLPFRSDRHQFYTIYKHIFDTLSAIKIFQKSIVHRKKCKQLGNPRKVIKRKIIFVNNVFVLLKNHQKVDDN